MIILIIQIIAFAFWIFWGIFLMVEDEVNRFQYFLIWFLALILILCDILEKICN